MITNYCIRSSDESNERKKKFLSLKHKNFQK